MRFGGTRLVGSWLGVVVVAGAVIGCGPQEPRFSSDFDPVDEMGEEDPNVDVKKATQHIEKAVALLRDDKLEDARKSLDEAEKFADELKRDEIRQVRQSIDSAEADKYVVGINKVAEDGKCDEALDAAAEVIDGKAGGQIPTFVRERSSKKLAKCLTDQLNVDLSIGRELADSERVKKALAKDDLVAFQTAVTDATVKELIGRFAEPIDERRWADAKTLLDELVQRKEAGVREYNRIMGVIRKGIAEDVAAKVGEALDDDNGVAGVLSQVDALIALADWGKKAGSAVGGEEMPDAVKRDRDTLALWSVCSGFRCTMVAPQQNWAYGHFDVMPALDPKGEKVDTVRHATEVWRIAESTSWVLIATKKPGALADVASRVPAASGWVKASALKNGDTAEWLPPGESVVGTRVWGPLREGQKEYELGQVIKLKGNDVAVERLADRSIVTVALSKVRFGTVSKETKILARCVHAIKPEPAVIDKVNFPKKGDPIVTYTCLNKDGSRSDITRDDQLGAVRANPADLPARR